MKFLFNKITLCLACILFLTGALSLAAGREGPELRKGSPELARLDESPKIALAYVVDGDRGVPDAYCFTHLVYAFAGFSAGNDSVDIKYPDKLRAMSELKKKNPELKVILGIGGYKKEGFSEMASDAAKRKSYVKSVKKAVDDFNLDGVDLDWEFPTTTAGGHTSRPDDKENYVILARDLRKALGKKKWISYYSNNSGNFIDHRGMDPYVSYVHVSGYNLAIPKEIDSKSLHQSPLYASKKTGGWCVMKSAQRHLDLGVKPEKLLIGVPMFGRGKGPFPTYTECRIFDRYDVGMEPLWDRDAQAPYYADGEGNLVMGFDDERSIAAKMEFIRSNRLPGIFVWHYDADFPDRRLSETIRELR